MNENESTALSLNETNPTCTLFSAMSNDSIMEMTKRCIFDQLTLSEESTTKPRSSFSGLAVKGKRKIEIYTVDSSYSKGLFVHW